MIILDKLSRIAQQRARDFDPDLFRLRGFSKTEYYLKLNDNASMFHLHYLIAQTVEQGCSYFDRGFGSPGFDMNLVGKNMLRFLPKIVTLPARIAILDSIFATMNAQTPDSQDFLAEHRVVKGTNIEKSDSRARIVVDEVYSAIERNFPNKQDRISILNVGVVGNFLAQLSKDKQLALSAVDFSEVVINSNIHGVRVQHAGSPRGENTLELISKSDIAIVTGMTLATNTLDEIVAAARDCGTVIILFAETGAHFAEEYCRMGIDVVVSEPFPFYLTCSGPSIINVFRKAHLEPKVGAAKETEKESIVFAK